MAFPQPEFQSAIDARARYRLTPRETHVLRRTPISGNRQRGGWTLWAIDGENLTGVVEELLVRGLLARAGAWPCADLTEEGRAALLANRPERMQP